MEHQQVGSREPDPFLSQPTEGFARKLAEVQREDPAGFEHIRKVMDRLLENPADADGAMHGAYRGKLKKYAGRKDYRIIYAWCESCRKANLHLHQACAFCGAIPDRSVVFFDLFRKNEHRERNY